MTGSWPEIESRLSNVVASPIVDEHSARSALGELLATLQQANEASPEGIVERLKDWIDKVIDTLTDIVRNIARATSFSLTVGTGVSVTVTFGPFEQTA